MWCRSDLGPEVGFEATGLIDSKLSTVGIWAKTSQEVRLSGCLVASQLGHAGALSGYEASFQMLVDATITPFLQESELPVDDYSRGVVFYLGKERGRIVGVLTWNLFGKMDLARQVGVAWLLLRV